MVADEDPGIFLSDSNQDKKNRIRIRFFQSLEPEFSQIKLLQRTNIKKMVRCFH